MSRRPLIATAVGTLAIGIALGQLLPAAFADPVHTEDATYRQLSVFAEALHTIRTQHLDPPSTQKLIEQAIRGMTDSLDEHSSFLDAELLQMLREDSAGTYRGIGVELSATPEGPRVTSVFPGSPAARQGILRGDLLLAIDGKALTDAGMADVVSEMRRHANATLRLTISRDDHIFDVDLEKDVVKMQPVSTERLASGVLWLKLQQFNDHVSRDVRNALATNETAQGVILDLRDNPGGLLDEAIEVARLFLRQGIIVQMNDGQEHGARVWNADARRQRYKGPLVVLINENSASGAEIVAAALRDNQRAQLVGQRSFGKGTVQSILPLIDGSALKLTVTEYFGPNGHCIHNVGVTPDFLVDTPQSRTAASGTHSPNLEHTGDAPEPESQAHTTNPAEPPPCRGSGGIDHRIPIVREPQRPASDDPRLATDLSLALAVELLQNLPSK